MRMKRILLLLLLVVEAGNGFQPLKLSHRVRAPSMFVEEVDVETTDVEPTEQDASRPGPWARIKNFFRKSKSKLPETPLDKSFDQLRQLLPFALVKDPSTALPTPIAAVDIRLHRPEKASFSDEVDRVVHNLKELEAFSRSNATLADFQNEIRGSWHITPNPAKISDLHIDFFPSLRISNLSLAVLDGDFELCKFYGDYIVDLQTRQIEFVFQDMVVLNLVARLPEKTKLSTTATGKNESSVETSSDKPFSTSIRTNQTSPFMEHVLNMFDDWHSTVLKQKDKIEKKIESK